MRSTRLWPVLATLVMLATACAEPSPMALPAGLGLDALTPARRALVRMTLTIDGDAVERPLVFDAEALTIAGELAIDNVGDGGERAVLLRAWGRFDDEAVETLLGEARGVVTVKRGAAAFVDFGDSTFDSCGSSAVGCAVRFDENRNAASNIDDLIAGRDPAPQAPFLQAPDTLQFPSGLRIGAIARQVVVIDNLAPHPVRIDTIRAAGGQGVGVSTYSADTDAIPPPRRVLASADLDVDGDEVSDFVVQPGEEAFIAVSFSPANGFLTTASVQVVAVDTVTLVGQAVRTKVIANPDGALRPRDPAYVEPDAVNGLTTDGGTVRAQAFPAAELFSGVEITGVDDPDTDVREVVQLEYRGARITGEGFDAPADVAFVVDVPAQARFTAALAGLADGTDVDVTVVDLADVAAPTLVGASANAGTSAEAVEFLNGTQPRRVAVVLGRVERDPPPSVPGGLSVADAIPFRLTCQVTRGPELVDVEPVDPVHGALAGGITVRLRGTGFFAPTDRAAGPHVRVTFDGVPVIGVPQVTPAGDDGVQTIAVVLPPGAASAADRPVAVTVENPTSAAGEDGDGQAVTLAGGFRYDLPSPRLTAITPDVATVDGGVVLVTLSGAFFFDAYGTPEVAFDDVHVRAELVDSATLRVQPPRHAAGDAQVRVQNRIFGGALGEPSNTRPFVYVAPESDPPRVDSLSPARGSADGGASVTITGANFVDARVFFGTAVATVSSSAPTQLIVVVPSTTASGPVDVLVQNRDGKTAVVAGGFVYDLPSPRIDEVFPARAVVAGGTPVIVDGAGFLADVDVAFVDDATSLPAAGITVVSAARMIVTTPPFPPSDDARLVVTNADGSADEVPFAFFHPAGAPPRISGVEPAVVDVDGGDVVTVTGSSFSDGGVDVIVGGTRIRHVAVDNDVNGLRRVAFAAPPGTPGPARVTIVNDDGQSDSDTLSYVDVGVPRIVAVSPTTLHASVRGDELFVFGERLTLLGNQASLTATAIVTRPEDGVGTVVERVTLRVDAVSETLARLTVSQALPEGDVVLELAGGGQTATFAALEARRPDVRQVQISKGKRGFDEATAVEVQQAMFLGRDLAGDRLSSVQIDAEPAPIECDASSADERVVVCTLTVSQDVEPTDPFTVTLSYSTGEHVSDSDVQLVDLTGGQSAPRIDGVESGVWGAELVIAGAGFQAETQFGAQLRFGTTAAPLEVTVDSSTRARFTARALPPGLWRVCMDGLAVCANTFVHGRTEELADDNNGTFAQATGVEPGRAFRGNLAAGDDDAFVFATNNGVTASAVTLQFIQSGAACAGVQMKLSAVENNAEGRLIASKLASDCAPVTVILPPARPEVVLVSLSGAVDSIGLAYELTVEATTPPPPAAPAASIVVTTVDDTAVVGDGECSLREAVDTATSGLVHSDCRGETGTRRISLPSGALKLNARLTLQSGLELFGVGSTNTTIEALGLGHFDVAAGGLRVLLQDLTLFGAEAGAITGAGSVSLLRTTIRDNSGGGVAVDGTVTAASSLFTNNTGRASGGAIDAAAVDLSDGCDFDRNTATDSGGAVRVNGSLARVRDTQFTNNNAGVAGGALLATGPVDIATSRFQSNSVGSSPNALADTRGGAIAIEAGSGSATIVDSTLRSNDALNGDGGGLSAARALTVTRTVFAGNTASLGGGVVADAPLDVSQSIFLANTAGNGGGLAVRAGASDTRLTTTHLQGNVARILGGGLYAQGNVAMFSTSIVANEANDRNQQGSGGGVAFVDSAKLSASYVTIAFNTAAEAGGGAFLGVSNGPHRVKDSILLPNHALQGVARHDCAGPLDSPAVLDVYGTVLVAATEGCVPSPTPGSFVLAADPGVRFVEDINLITNAAQPVDDARRALSQAAPRISAVILPPATAQVGSCFDLANNRTANDAAGLARPQSGCTVGATELSAEPTTTITVDSATDDGVGCTLRNALASARDNASTSCTHGSTGIDRIVFDPNHFADDHPAVAVDGFPRIVLLGEGELGIDSAEVIIDGITGRETSAPIEILSANGQRVFDVRLPEFDPGNAPVSVRLRGLRLVGSESGAPGSVIMVSRGSVLLDETTAVGAAGVSGGSAIDVRGGVRSALTFERSTLEHMSRGDAVGALIESAARFYARRSTLLSESASLLDVQGQAVASLEQSTLAVLDSTPTP
ncbi:MAG: hypothetical protein FJ137_11790, partial [Deltaproteobacteria bacterium]|nr:hypothetical protein [Deltaproteobacteria bacterium]